LISWQSFSLQDAVDGMMKSLFNYVPVKSRLYDEVKQGKAKALLDSKLHSNKIAVIFSMIPFTCDGDTCQQSMVLTAVDAATGDVLWLYPIPSQRQKQPVSKAQLLLARHAAAAHPAEVTLLLSYGGGRSFIYRVNTATGASLGHSDQLDTRARELVNLQMMAASPEQLASRSNELFYLQVCRPVTCNYYQLIAFM
jgi:hypothetical protein